MQFVYVPSTKGDYTAVFATNLKIGPDEAETVSRRYSRRWQIENEYKSIKHEFLAKTSSKDYRVRLFYFVFAVLLYNIWRLTDFLMKADVYGPVDYAPVLTAGECVEIVVSAPRPPDQTTELCWVCCPGVVTLFSTLRIHQISHNDSIYVIKNGKVGSEMANRLTIWRIFS